MDKHLKLLTKLLKWWWHEGWYNEGSPNLKDIKWHIHDRLKENNQWTDT